MLSAILHGKKTGTGLAGTRLKIGETQGAEDVLTASVFERIAYLSDDIFRQFIRNLLSEANDIGALEKIEFWVSLTLYGIRVEPDVILTGSNSQSIVVEAKRYDFQQQQYAEQLANEIMATNENDIKNPVLLTIGGLNNYTNAMKQTLKKQIDALLANRNFLSKYQLFCVSWQEVYTALEQAVPHDSQHYQRLLSDIRQTYDWHGIRHQPCRWLDKLAVQDITHTEFPTIFTCQNLWTALHSIGLTHHHFPSFLGD